MDRINRKEEKMRLILRWLIIAIALMIAVYVVPGIDIVGTNGLVAVAVMAVVLGLVNALFRPIMKFLSCGLIFLTLGLFTLVINAATFLLASWITDMFLHVGLTVHGSFWTAFLAALVISIVSWVLNIFLPDRKRKSKA
jgi:putative membrane protein